MISDFIVFLILFLFIWLGYKSGFIKTLFDTFSYIISIILGVKIYPFVSEVLKKSFVYEYVNNIIGRNINNSLSEFSLISKLLSSGYDKSINSLSEIILSIISFIAVIIISKILLSLISRCISFVSKIPVISFFNRILGAVLGAIKGVLILYLAFLLIFIIPVKYTENVVKNINTSKIAYKFYNENIILDLIGKDFLIKW